MEDNHEREGGPNELLRASVYELFTLGGILTSIPFNGLWTTTRYLAGRTQYRRSLSNTVKYKIIHQLNSNLSASQIRAIMPTSASKILGWTLSKPFRNYGVKYSTDDYTAYWLVEVEDRKPSDPVLIFCHGGGYVFPLSLAQVWHLTKIVKAFPNVRLSVLIMDYSLSPEYKYPTQIEEISSLYHNLLDVEGCENIILSGESCGANLILALLAHLKHGFPAATQILSKEKLTAIKAVILVSPWVNLSVEKVVTDLNSSYVRNAKEDILTTERLNFWATEYCPDTFTRQTSPWVSPLNIGENTDFWEDIFPDNTLVTWGEEELMRDDCSRWAKDVAKLTNTLEVPNGIHVDVLFDSKSPVNGKIVELLKAVFHQQDDINGTSEEINSGGSDLLENGDNNRATD